MADASLIWIELHMVPFPNVTECPDFHWEGTEKQKDPYRTIKITSQTLGLKAFFQKQGNEIWKETNRGTQWVWFTTEPQGAICSRKIIEHLVLQTTCSGVKLSQSHFTFQ